MFKLFFVVGIVGGLAGPALADGDCDQALALHGMLSRAQFQCGFSKYSEAKMQLASVCMHTVGEDNASSDLKVGMNKFDSEEKKLGKRKVCSEMLSSFPDYIHR